MGFSSKGYWPAGIGLVALVGALVASLGILAWPPEAAEGKKLKLSCEEGRLLSLEARAALAPDVFQALEEKCGLQLKGGENIPDRPVTATYEKVTLEEIIESLIRLTDLPNTLLASLSSGALKLVVLATGREGVRKAPLARRRGKPKVVRAVAVDEGEVQEAWAGSAFEVDEEEAEEARMKAARRRYLLAKTDAERQAVLEELKELDEEEAEDLEDLDEEELADEREEAALQAALEQFYLTTTEQGRQWAYEEVKRLDPDEAEELLEMDAEELADEREEAALEAALEQFYLSTTEQGRQWAYEELKSIDPDEAEDLLD